MDSQRPKRLTKKPTRYSQSPTLIALDPQNPDIPEVRRSKKRPLQAIPVEPVPIDISDALPSTQREIPPYTPPLGYIPYKAGEPVVEASDELSTFLLFLSEPCLQQIMAATNSYAENDRNSPDPNESRLWTPTTRAELLRFIGCLFYIGIHKEMLRDNYWSPPSRLGAVISRTRFE
jgi:hypothetical protein